MVLQVLVALLHVLALANDVSCRSNDFGRTDYDAGAVYNVMDFGAVGEVADNSDDTNALTKAWDAACRKGGTATIRVPAGKTFVVKPIKFDGKKCRFSSVHFQIEGEIVPPNRKGWANCQKDWIAFKNINGLTIDGNGLIQGHGDHYWSEPVNQIDDDENDEDDDESSNTLFKDCKKAPVVRIELWQNCENALRIESCSNVNINHLNTKDTPGVHINVKQSTDVEISNVNITAPAKSKNTDGINVAKSQRVTIRDSNIGTGDDCIAVNTGSQFFSISNIACGPGHGISIGSLGKKGQTSSVEDVHVRDCSFTDTTNGARIKTWQGGRGYARRITYEGITLNNAGNPIFIDQSYCPHRKCLEDKENAVDISDVSFIGFRGSSKDSEAIILNCAGSQGCTDIVLDDVDISSNDGKPAEAVCNNAHGNATQTSPDVPCLHQEINSIGLVA